MKPLELKQMEQTAGGVSWWCALAVATAVITDVATAGVSTVAGVALVATACL